MKVLDLCCGQGHIFEGWFDSLAGYESQRERGLVSCPVCQDLRIERRPSAPRLNLRVQSQAATPAARPEAPHAPAAATGGSPSAQVVAQWLESACRELLARTEDVGERFPEEARAIHRGDAPERGIRGQASAEEREALREEGIEVLAVPLPEGWDRPKH
ncbi:DUF1178 family protein [Ideonella livida]|uniref:DUF1178 family protein n=1 Tax=Ideonella livida TaxID=2707176 RepID=A0A7C9TJ06_9BURK|nr:DUF1178 family protein [Ideonella livida]NDY91438.1 DUF1178 family protein [Ideonella livida]